MSVTERFERCDQIAKAFHTTYEALAPYFGYETRFLSAVPWDQVPDRNKRLMRADVDSLNEAGVIPIGPDTAP